MDNNRRWQLPRRAARKQDHPRLLECVLAVCGAGELERAGAGEEAEAVLNAEVAHRQGELKDERRRRRRLGKHVSQTTHRSLYRQFKFLEALARKVHRLLRCLDDLEVKLGVREGLVGATLALDRSVEGGGGAARDKLLLLSAHPYIIRLFAFAFSYIHVNVYT